MRVDHVGNLDGQEIADCRMARVTPPGRGAVATLAIWGPAVSSIVSSCFLPSAGSSFSAAPDRLFYGRWLDIHGEEIVLRIRGPQDLEIHGHGGEAAIAAIMLSLERRGVQPACADEWLSHQAIGSIEHDALSGLVRAGTERIAAILLDQYRGSLRRAIERVIDAMAADDRDRAESDLRQLLASFNYGQWVNRPARIVLAGPPNVGKSSLINTLLGFKRSIVDARAGTTRDVLTANTAIDGWPIELADTAGLRCADDELETAGVQLAESEIDRADVVIFVGDCRQAAGSPTPQGSRPCLSVLNKCDLLEDPRTDHRASVGLRTSAVTGEGIPQLLSAISASLAPEPPAPGDAVVFMERQRDTLLAALECLTQGGMSPAEAALAGLLQAGT